MVKELYPRRFGHACQETRDRHSRWDLGMENNYQLVVNQVKALWPQGHARDVLCNSVVLHCTQEETNRVLRFSYINIFDIFIAVIGKLPKPWDVLTI